MKRATHFKKSDELKNGISIHALVKRATYPQYALHISMGISIHALVKRATGFEMSFLLPYLISIHALVKRATLDGGLCLWETLDFNPRPREEGDFFTMYGYTVDALFQSTPS